MGFLVSNFSLQNRKIHINYNPFFQFKCSNRDLISFFLKIQSFKNSNRYFFINNKIYITLLQCIFPKFKYSNRDHIIIKIIKFQTDNCSSIMIQIVPLSQFLQWNLKMSPSKKIIGSKWLEYFDYCTVELIFKNAIDFKYMNGKSLTI